jgi:Flp pilus assembly protein CpaB
MSFANLRDGNVKLAGLLAAVAAVLTMIYVSHGGSGGGSTAQAAGTKQAVVYVATRDIPIGTSAGTLFSRGYAKATRVSADAIAPGAVVDRRQLKGLVAVQPLYDGEQLTERRFGSSGATGLLSDLRGTGRVFQLAGDARQLLGGVLQAGDHVDVVAMMHGTTASTAAFSKIVLRNLLVTGIGDGGKDAAGTAGSGYVTLQLSDQEARKLFFVVKNGDWSLVLRPALRPGQSADHITSINTILNGEG